MATIGLRGTINPRITIELSFDEAGALDALAGYGADAFLETFYGKLGEAYMKPFEAGLRSLFSSVHGGDASVQTFMKRAEDAENVMRGILVAIRPEGSKQR